MSSRAWQVRPFRGFSLTHPIERQAWFEQCRINGGNTVEVGSFMGVSAAELAVKMPDMIVFSVDNQGGNYTQHLIGDTYQLNRQPNMRLWVGTLPELIAEVGHPKDVRTIWIDGFHSYEACRIDLEAAITFQDCQSILVHDYACRCFADDLPPACRDVLGERWKLLKVVDTTAVFRRILQP